MFQKIKFWVEDNKPKMIVFGIMAALSLGIGMMITGDVTAGAHRR